MTVPNGTTRGAPQPLSAARERALRAVDELSATDPVTLAAVAARLGGHPNSTRQHLDRLHADGLVDVRLLAQSRPGRRPQGFTVTPHGRRALAAVHAREYSQLAGAVARYQIQNGGGAEDARMIGELWGDDRARPYEDTAGPPMEALIEVLDILGFAPRVEQGQEGATLVLHACPLVNAGDQGLRGQAPFLCALHEGMIHGVLRRLGGGDGVLLERSVPGDGGCRIHLS